MVKLTGLHPHRTGRGFTLVELLLTVVLLLLLASAAVISFSTLLSGSELEEGGAQMEGLMRFARAHAANTGKKVQLVFEEQTSDGIAVPLGNVRVLWESDPIRFPGNMTELGGATRMARSVNSLVQVEDVRPPEEAGAVAVQEQTSFAPLTFYPDGSSDSAEIILASRGTEEKRRVFIRITGITGAIRRGWLAEQQQGDAAEEEWFP